jgi:hypothetical protein
MINFDKKNYKFLSKLFGENTFSKINNFKAIESISDSDIKNRLAKLSDYDKKSIELSLSNLKSLRASDTDIKELFSLDFLLEDEKKEILSQFIPYLTLGEARKLNLLTLVEANDKKKLILEDILKPEGLTPAILNKAVEFASLEDIKIKSSEFFSNESNLNIISD